MSSSLAFSSLIPTSLTKKSASFSAICSKNRISFTPFKSSRKISNSNSTSVFCCAEQISSQQQKQKKDEEQPLDETAMRAAEIHEVMQGLKDFKDRIIDDATKLAKKVRAPKKQLEAALEAHPDIIKINSHIADLEEELKLLGDR